MKILDYTKGQYRSILERDGKHWVFVSSFASKREAVKRGKALERMDKKVMLYGLGKEYAARWMLYAKD